MQQEINSFNSDDLSSSSQHGGLSAATRVNIQFILSFILIDYSQQVVNTIMFVTKFQIAVVQNSDNYPLRNHYLQDNRSGFPHTCLPDSDLLCVLLTIAYLDIVTYAKCLVEMLQAIPNVPAPKPPFESKAECEVIDMKMIFLFSFKQNYFHEKGFALSASF